MTLSVAAYQWIRSMILSATSIIFPPSDIFLQTSYFSAYRSEVEQSRMYFIVQGLVYHKKKYGDAQIMIINV
jgi:hypothetical protein